MKRLGSLLMIISATLLFAGCSNVFEDIFNGNNKDAISPLSDNSDASLTLSKVDDALIYFTMGGIVDLSKVTPNCAAIINSRSALESALQAGMISTPRMDQSQLEWPEIDLNQYSLVLEICFVTPSYWVLGSQRILNKKNAPELYLEIIDTSPKGAIKSADGTYYYLARLYPKIPFDGEIPVNTWIKKGQS